MSKWVSNCACEFVTYLKLQEWYKKKKKKVLTTFLTYDFTILSLSHIIDILPCKYCATVIAPDVDEIVKHCRLCERMPRPDLFRNKYVCYQCDYSSYATTHIKDHVRIHTGERPYKCHICSRDFITSGNYKRHMGIAHKRWIQLIK